MEPICWRALSLEQARALYTPHLVRDFPPEELKPFSAIEAMWQKGCYEALGCFDENENLRAYAFMLWADHCPALLLDYYAVLPQGRQAGLGSALLPQLLALYKARGFTGVLIESEDPDFAPEPALARRRLGFYTRAGLNWPGLAARVFDGHYLVGLLTGENDTAPDYPTCESWLEKTYKAMLPPALYKGNVEIFRKKVLL